MPRAATFGRELLLREQALAPCALDASSQTDHCLAISVLADFYEEHGQPSRATLWREQLDPHRHYGPCLPPAVPDLLTRPHRPQGFDCRRNQMMWLLRQQGVNGRKVGIAFGLSATRVEQIIALEDRRIRMHARNEQKAPTLKATTRLIAAGAFGQRPGVWDSVQPQGGFHFGDEPPEDWPAEHKRK
jgi:hypothetical protein